MVKRLLLTVLTLVLSLGLLPEGHIRAQNQIANFHLSNVSYGPEVIEFASLTPTIYVVFDYADAANLVLTVKIFDGGGITIFEKRDTYNGSGTRSMKVSGEEVFKKYQTLAQTYGTSMKGYIDQAVDESTPTMARRLVEFALSSGTQLEGVLWTLSDYDLSPAAADHLDQARTYLDQALGEGQEIINVSITPDDQVSSRVEVMQSLAEQALDEMEEVIILSEEEGKTFLDGAYTASIYQDSNIVDSIEWMVSPHGEEVPTVSPTPSPPTTATRTPTPTSLPTATQTSLPPTATRTRRPTEPTWTPRPSDTPVPERPTPTPVPELPTSLPPTAAYPGAATPTHLPAITGTAPATPTAQVVISTPTGPTATTEFPPPATAPATPPTPGTAPVQTLPVSVTIPAVATGTATVVLPPATWEPLPMATPTPPSAPASSPLNTLGIMGGAVALGLLALWIRKNLNL